MSKRAAPEEEEGGGRGLRRGCCARVAYCTFLRTVIPDGLDTVRGNRVTRRARSTAAAAPHIVPPPAPSHRRIGESVATLAAGGPTICAPVETIPIPGSCVSRATASSFGGPFKIYRTDSQLCCHSAQHRGPGVRCFFFFSISRPPKNREPISSSRLCFF